MYGLKHNSNKQKTENKFLAKRSCQNTQKSKIKYHYVLHMKYHLMTLLNESEPNCVALYYQTEKGNQRFRVPFLSLLVFELLFDHIEVNHNTFFSTFVNTSPNPIPSPQLYPKKVRYAF